MKEGKEMECKGCDIHCKGDMGCCCGDGMHHGKGHIFMTIGILALVYGVVNYLRMAYVWPPYAGWIAGGAALILIGWSKKHWMHKG